MDRRKLSNLVLVLMVIAALLVGVSGAASAAVPTPDVAVSVFEREATRQGEIRAAAAPTSPVDESRVPHYFGPNTNWALSPFTVPDVSVTIAPPANTTSYGNALVARAHDTDSAVNVFVVNTHAPLPVGVLTAFETWVQAGSVGGTFNAYVLRPTGVVNRYTVVLDSGPLTVSAAPGAAQTFPLATPFDVLAGDLIAHYGQGIPIDIAPGTVGVDTVFFPAGPAPALGAAIDVAGDATFPICDPVTVCGDRTYSIAASVGAGATAVASVGANGVITGITVTNPGSGYTSPPAPAVTITGAGTGATAEAVVTLSGVVTAITVDAAGTGYTAPIVKIGTLVGGGALPADQATATATGGVEDNIVVSSGGSQYTFPVVEFDMPGDPNGTQAQGHAVLDDGVQEAPASSPRSWLTTRARGTTRPPA